MKKRDKEYRQRLTLENENKKMIVFLIILSVLAVSAIIDSIIRHRKECKLHEMLNDIKKEEREMGSDDWEKKWL